jgi:GH35 family endo-1,4-beta-xylanase
MKPAHRIGILILIGVIIIVILILSTGESSGQGAQNEILAQADARIEKYRKGDVVLKLLMPGGKSIEAGLAVKIEQVRHEFLFGCNIFKLGGCRTQRDNKAYEKHFAELLNFATLPFYWWNYEQQEGKPNDARTEKIVRWCKAHQVTTKGHPLAWNWKDPDWLSGDPEAVSQTQFKRVRRCVSRFKNDIDIWDVVNEATHYDRPECQKRAPLLTEAITEMGTGEYLRQAFGMARQANPPATLIINDYRTDVDYAKKVLRQLVDEKGQPLYDVIGIQSHMHGGYWGARKTWEVCERFARFGRPLHFTEVTLLSGQQGYNLRDKNRDPNFKWRSTTEGEQRQAEQVAEFYRVLFSHPAVEAITWWDFSDQGAWQGAPAGLVRSDMTPKPAYKKLKQMIKNKWWTQTTAKVREKGKVSFRGFYGQYQLTATTEKGELTGTFLLEKDKKGTIVVHLNNQG